MIAAKPRERLRIAVQKSGRLAEPSQDLLARCGLQFRQSRDKLFCFGESLAIDLLLVRDDDIPGLIAQGVCDLGIVGRNVLSEHNAVAVACDTASFAHELNALGFGRCHLAIALPHDADYAGAQSLAGKRIATTYPALLGQWLQGNAVSAEIVVLSGSVEIAPRLGTADAICDLVRSGSTLFTNGLKEVEVILKSEAVLTANKKLSEENKAILDKLLLRINAVKTAKNNKYILLNAPNNQLKNISSLLPGIKSPTIVPLAEEGWSSVQSVVNENDFWEVIEKLKSFGAEGIIVLPIEKMIV